MIDVTPFVKSIEGKPVAVFGLARSGLSSVRALIAAGAKVYAWDDREEVRAAALDLGAELRTLDNSVLLECGALILAPGVPLYYPEPHPVVKAAQMAGLEILCDIEVFYRSVKALPDAPVLVGITGTNGKSTTTALSTHVLNETGLSAVMGGNIGVPVLDLDLAEIDGGVERGVVVLELSSYQLDLCPDLALHIAVFLNISADHLDRHGTMDRYFDAKARIFKGSKIQLICVDDEGGQDMFTRIGGLSFMHNFDAVADIKNPNLQGDHNKQNMAAALMIARELDRLDDDTKDALESFPGLAHRQKGVRRIGNIVYVNDSKGSNAQAASRALATYQGEKIFWIAGGRAKDGGLSGLEVYVPDITHAYLIGEAADDFASWCTANGLVHTVCGTLDKAVEAAHAAAHGAGEGVVLLSPACASWDQFCSFEVRGDMFEALVKAL